MLSQFKLGSCAAILSLCVLFGVSESHALNSKSSCTYETWDWDSVRRKPVNLRLVTKKRSELSPEEKGSVPGCSVCQEDQVEIQVAPKINIKVCQKFQKKISRAIKEAVRSGFQISSAVGYRVGKSKGPLNESGQRTEFSNHSFGTAVDFNSERNGLYDSCVKFGPRCRLIRGGEYLPAESGSITKDSIVYKSMLDAGFKWGGEIDGKQKDFMHFSLTGM